MRESLVWRVLRNFRYWFRSLLGWFWFLSQFITFSKVSDKRFTLRWGDRWPCLLDHTTTTGFDAHYLYHTSWAARLLAQNAPHHHVDISSCLRFVSLVSAFIPITFYDYRPADITLGGLTSGKVDLTALHFEDDSITSLSCMHVVEHIGLGRYGEPLDPRGDLKAMRELQRVVAPEGDLYFVVPIGSPRIQFNAHRIYKFRQIVEQFSDMTLIQFSLVTDNGKLVINPLESIADRQHYGCGCFWFRNSRGVQ